MHTAHRLRTARPPNLVGHPGRSRLEAVLGKERETWQGDKQRRGPPPIVQIRRWVESKGGWPAHVKGTERGNESCGLLRIDFPGYSGAETLKKMSWDDWFRWFRQEEARVRSPADRALFEAAGR